MAELFDSPPLLTGSDSGNIEALYRYLCIVSEQLNVAMESLDAGTVTAKDEQIQLSAGGSGTDTAEKERNALRSMIIKNAKIVQTEMDELRTILRTEYATQSEFGDLQETLENELTVTASGINQRFTRVEAVTNSATDYMQTTRSRIFIGMLDNQQTGIAIGEDITDYDASGNPVLKSANKAMTLTSDKLSFWRDGYEVAYVSGHTLYITDCWITNRLRIGTFSWRILTGGSLGLIAGGT